MLLCPPFPCRPAIQWSSKGLALQFEPLSKGFGWERAPWSITTGSMGWTKNQALSTLRKDLLQFESAGSITWANTTSGSSTKDLIWRGRQFLIRRCFDRQVEVQTK